MVPDGFVEFTKKKYGEDNEKAIKIAEEINNECAKITHDDRCELAVLLMECVMTVLGRHAETAEESK